MARITIEGRTHRLVPTRHPPIQTFDEVASVEDLAAVMELEGWTNDRLVVQRLRRLPRERWVFGRPNASVVMAAFLHASPVGARFNGPELGAWYGALAVRTAIAEVSHHLRREAVNLDWPELRGQYRAYEASLAGAYEDVRRRQGAGTHGAGHDRDLGRQNAGALGPAGEDARHHGAESLRADLVTALHDPADWSRSQAFAERVRAQGGDGIVYDSLRHAGGVAVVAYDPRNVLDVTIGTSFELIVPIEGRIIARRLARSAPRRFRSQARPRSH